ncbi:MAG: hypothetical protein IIW98_05700, partial [Bacteroidaceae bacterium]|nr:hypothetical protein [Bacteroidaceae bacterium]
IKEAHAKARAILSDNRDKLDEIPLWKMVTKKWLKVKGHNVSRDKDGHFTYSAFTRKGLFCQDMFYSCPNLQFVILPRKGRIYDRVVIVGDPIRYKKVKRGTE